MSADTTTNTATASASGGGQLRSRSSFSITERNNPQSGEADNIVESPGQQRGWLRSRASRLGGKRRACAVATIVVLVAATVGMAIPLEDVNIVSACHRYIVHAKGGGSCSSTCGSIMLRRKGFLSRASNALKLQLGTLQTESNRLVSQHPSMCLVAKWQMVRKGVR